MAYFHKKSLSRKIFSVLATVLFLFFLTTGLISSAFVKKVISIHFDEDLKNTLNSVKNIVETSANLSVRNYLRAVAEQDKKIIEDLYNQSLSSDFSDQKAQDQAKKILLTQKLGLSGYVYVIDSSGIVLSHPTTSLIGDNVSDFDFIRTQVKKKVGFIHYEWQGVGETRTRKKILYMEYFEPWDWIISVSAYKDELTSLIHVKDFKDQMLSIKIGEHGYPFVLSMDGEMIAHPSLSGNVINNGAEYSDLVDRLIKEKEGQAYYSWIDPVSGKKEDKFIMFSFVEEFGWIVAATGYVTDFYSPLRALKIVYAILLLLSLFLSVIISYFLSKSITKPLILLLEKITDESGALNIKSQQNKQGNEIEEIANFFSQYMHILTENNDKLGLMLIEKNQNIEELNIFKKVFDTTRDGVTITDAEGLIKIANQSFCRITGFNHIEAIGADHRILKSDRHTDSFYASMWKDIKEEGFWRGEIWNKRKNGEVYPEWLTISAVQDNNGITTHYAAIFNDISLFHKQKDRIKFLAYHDALTKLPNRLFIIETLEQAVEYCQRYGGEVVCLTIDIDSFRAVNDSLGHLAGDDLLKRFAIRLQSVVREEDSLGRIDGDEFVYVFHNQDKSVDYLSVIEDLSHCVKEPFSLYEFKHYFSISIGVAIFPVDGSTAEDLLKRADLALEKAKKEKGNSYALFDNAMEIDIIKKIKYLSKIRTGIKNDEFIPFYQPKVDLKTGRVVGMEALARWKTGDKLIGPGTFIPLSEESGLIIPLSKLISQQVLKDIAILHKQGHYLKIAINLSPLQLSNESTTDELISMISTAEVAPEYIEFEVTESTLMHDPERSKEILDKIVSYGFTIAIDDFGTGYSSLQYMKQFPISTLKIDMSFVSGIGKDENDEILIRTIVEMANQFNLDIVAEGIEEIEQEKFLSDLDCHFGQGYLYGKPMSFESFCEWLQR
ncbi:MAG: EAL domain-containing protein [Desulfotalea sp.]